MAYRQRSASCDGTFARNTEMTSEEIRQFSLQTVNSLVKNSEKNSLKAFDEPAWDSPILGFAAGSDPLFK